jgi:phosphatidylglycerophosphate synthase
MFDHLLRGLKDRILAPLAHVLRGVPPNFLTVFACLLGLGAAGAASQAMWGIGLALWLANRVVDGLDGAVARVAQRQSDFGGYLDILLDFVVYAAVPIGLVVGQMHQGAPDAVELALDLALLEALFFVNACSWMYLAAVLEKRQAGATSRGELTTITMPPAIVAGFETIVFFSLFFLFPAHLSGLMLLMAALVAVNIAQRLVWAARQL